MGSDNGDVTWRGLLALALLVLATTALGLFGRRGPSGESTLERLEQRGAARVGIANEAPYGYLDTFSGRVTGEAPEIAREILGRLGIESMEAVSVTFGALIPGLKAGRFDLIAAGMYITPARCDEIAFSRPTYRVGEAFIVEAGNPHDLHSFGDVKKRDVRLGVVSGTVELQYVQRLGIPDEKVVLFGDNVSALAGVRSGRIDAYACTMLTAEDLLRKAEAPDLERARPFRQPVIDGEQIWGYGAFGFRKADSGLLEAFDRELAAFIGTEEHLELVRPYGFGEETLPGDVTVEELCQEEDE